MVDSVKPCVTRPFLFMEGMVMKPFFLTNPYVSNYRRVDDLKNGFKMAPISLKWTVAWFNRP